MLFEIKGICQNCADEVILLVHNGKPISHCSSCKEDPFQVQKIAGVLYVVKNSNQLGVKIGLTTKSVEERMKQLSSTGVPGKFEAIAIFPVRSVNLLKKYETKVHEKLRTKRLEKEHFDLDPVEAVLKVYRTLNKSIEPIFYDDDNSETFKLQLKRAKIEMAIKLKGKK